DYQMFMEPEILAECVFVLDSFYEIDRSEIATLLSRLLQHPGIRSGQMELLQVSLELFAQTNVDMADCLLAARSKVQGCAVATFDKDFKKLGTIDLLEF
ncbi:MAG: PIN domain-containing protein, partial [Verrucomicrobiota bacterium]